MYHVCISFKPCSRCCARFIRFAAGLVMVATGCGSVDDPIVARVDSDVISASLLQVFVKELPDGLRTKKRGDEARRHYLQSLVDRRLLLLEAQSLGLDTTSTVRWIVRDAVDARARALYRSRYILPAARVTEEDIRHRFDEQRLGRQRKFSAIIVANRADIDSVTQALRSGTSFEEIASQRSLDSRSSGRGGELGFIGLLMAPRLHIPVEVFRDLPAGEVSAPLPVGDSWHVVRFGDERQLPYADVRPAIERAIFQERLIREEGEHLDLLKESLKVRLEGSGLGQIISAYTKRNLDDLQDVSAPVYTYDEGSISVGRIHQELVRHHIKSGFLDTIRAAASLDEHFLSRFVVEEAARRKGIYKEAEILRLTRLKEEDALLEALRRTAVREQVEIDTGEVRQYYLEHPDFFHHEAAVWVEEVLLPTRAEAAQARRRIEAGATFSSMAEASRRSDATRFKNRYHFHKRGEIRYPLLVPALLSAEVGEITGPLEVEGGFSIFRVLEHEVAGLQKFTTVHKQVRGFLRTEREQIRLKKLMEEVRSRYADRVTVFEENLIVALPDSLLSG